MLTVPLEYDEPLTGYQQRLRPQKNQLKGIFVNDPTRGDTFSGYDFTGNTPIR
jgi:hypothetical protein